MAKADVAEAADYVKEILDNMVTDMYERQVDRQAEFEDAINEKVDNLKARVDEGATQQIDFISRWIDRIHRDVQDATDSQPAEDEIADEVSEVVDEASAVVDESLQLVDDFFSDISLAKKSSKKAKKSTDDSNAFYFGYGALTLGAAATCAYLYKKRSEEKNVNS